MIIDLRTIQHKSRSYEISLGEEWWDQPDTPGDDQIIGLDGPLSAGVRISRAGKRFILEGRLKGTLRMVCDRCTETYARDLEHEFKVYLEAPSRSGDMAEVELMEDDMEVGFISEDEIELDDIIREQIYLSLPVKSICSEGCLGLCPVCGGNRNKNQCECDGETGHPAFSILKNLNLKENGD